MREGRKHAYARIQAEITTLRVAGVVYSVARASRALCGDDGTPAWINMYATLLWGQRVHSCVISTHSLYLLCCVGQYMHAKRHQRHTGRDGDKTSLFEDTGESTEASSCRPIAPCSFGGMDARNSAETSVRGNQEGM